MTVVPQAQPETEIVEGTVIGITQKGADKWQVGVQPDGSQYSRNLWTKDDQLVAQLSQMIGARLAFQCGISHWTNAQNQPVRSLWINGVGGAGAMAQPQPMQQQPAPMAQQMQPVMQQPQPQMQPQMQQGFQPQVQAMTPAPVTVAQAPQPIDQSSRWLQERAVERPYIHRQTASKVAVHLLSFLPAEQRTLDTLLTLSEMLVGYYEHGMQRANPGQWDGDEHGGAPVGDDGIPF